MVLWLLSRLYAMLTLPMDMGTFSHNGVTHSVRTLAVGAGRKEMIDISRVISILTHPVWDHHNRPVTPLRVILNPNAYPEHDRRILDADLSYPILVFPDEYGNLLVADGCHRICKAHLDGHRFIWARCVSVG